MLKFDRRNIGLLIGIVTNLLLLALLRVDRLIAMLA